MKQKIVLSLLVFIIAGCSSNSTNLKEPQEIPLPSVTKAKVEKKELNSPQVSKEDNVKSKKSEENIDKFYKEEEPKKITMKSEQELSQTLNLFKAEEMPKEISETLEQESNKSKVIEEESVEERIVVKTVEKIEDENKEDLEDRYLQLRLSKFIEKKSANGDYSVYYDKNIENKIATAPTVAYLIIDNEGKIFLRLRAQVILSGERVPRKIVLLGGLNGYDFLDKKGSIERIRYGKNTKYYKDDLIVSEGIERLNNILNSSSVKLIVRVLNRDLVLDLKSDEIDAIKNVVKEYEILSSLKSY